MLDIVREIRQSPALQFLRSSGRDQQYPKNLTIKGTIRKGKEYFERQRHGVVNV